MANDIERVADPNNIPVTFANVFGGGGTVNGVVNFALCVNRFTPLMNGKIEADTIVAARIRVDVQTAIALRDFLNMQIKLLSVPQEQAN